MFKRVFNPNTDKGPVIGVEIVGAKLTYSRCEFDACQIKFSSVDSPYEEETKLQYSHLIGDTCCWTFREHAEFSMDHKLLFTVRKLIGWL
jgi:hypothetical protein